MDGPSALHKYVLEEKKIWFGNFVKCRAKLLGPFVCTGIKKALLNLQQDIISDSEFYRKG